jgi:hypothetical protein
LTAPLKGNPEFATAFQQTWPAGCAGAVHCRDLDLQTRLFKYPCSFLIYSDAFAKLPPVMKDERASPVARHPRPARTRSPAFAKIAAERSAGDSGNSASDAARPAGILATETADSGRVARHDGRLRPGQTPDVDCVNFAQNDRTDLTAAVCFRLVEGTGEAAQPPLIGNYQINPLP